MKNPLSHSLSLRLLGIFIVTAILASALLILLFSRGLGSQWQTNIKPHLALYINYVNDDLGYPPNQQRAEELAHRVPVNIYVYLHEKHVFSTNNVKLNISELNFRRPHRPAQDSALNQGGRPRGEIAFNENHRSTVLRVRQQEYSVYFELHRRASHWQAGNGLLFALAALTSVLLLSFVVIRKQLSPIRRIQHSVQLMTDGKLNHRIAVKGRDDLAQLGTSINTMADRIEKMLDAKRQLLLAISHELRSPLARSRVATELLPPSLNKIRISDDLTEMEKMITDIMESERLRHHGVLNRKSLNLSQLLQDVVGSFEEKIEIELPTQPVILNADEVRLKILFRNLIGNAIQYGQVSTANTHAYAAVRLQISTKEIVVEIIDEGPGIDKEHLAAVTEPFYRPDASRTRTSGGFGLGLTLANLIAIAHDGTLTIESDPANTPGTIVRVSLPINET